MHRITDVKLVVRRGADDDARMLSCAYVEQYFRTEGLNDLHLRGERFCFNGFFGNNQIFRADAEHYVAMRVGGNLDKVTEGLQYLNEWRDRLNTNLPEMIIASTFMRQNIEDLPGLVEYHLKLHVARESGT